MRVRSKRLFAVLVGLTALLLLASLLAVGFYRPTVPQDTPPTFLAEADLPPVSGRTSHIYHFLVVGRDRASASTDVMALCAFDTDSERITVLQLPRDTLVRHDGVPKKLNAVFATEKARAGGDDLAAMRGLSNMLSESLCVAIDYRVLIYLDGFVSLVDAIGGVPMDVPFDMDYDDPSQNLHIHLQKGKQTLSGKDAESFVRYRKGNHGEGYKMGDLERLEAQKKFGAATLRAVRAGVTVRDLPELARTALDAVRSDLSLSDTVFFAKHALRVTDNAVSLVTLPGRVAENYYVLNRKETLRLLNEFFNVYDVDIPAPSFDKNEIFNLPTNKTIHARYHGSIPPPPIFSASELGVQKDTKTERT